MFNNLQSAFYTVGIAYFGLWGIVTILALFFGVKAYLRLKKQAQDLKEKLSFAETGMFLLKSTVFRKGMMVATGAKLASKALGWVTSQLSQEEEEDKKA